MQKNVFWLYGVIESDGDGAAMDSITPKMVRDELAKADRSAPILLRINSPGGSVFAAVAMRTLFAEWRAGVDVQVDGLAASAASYIATVGRTVAMAPGSMLMIHDAWGVTIGNADDHAQAADVLDQVSANIVGAYARKSGKSHAEIRTAMKNETWFTDQGAVDFGLADGIVGADGQLTLSARSSRNPRVLRQQLDALLAQIS